MAGKARRADAFVRAGHVNTFSVNSACARSAAFVYVQALSVRGSSIRVARRAFAGEATRTINTVSSLRTRIVRTFINVWGGTGTTDVRVKTSGLTTINLNGQVIIIYNLCHTRYCYC